MVRIVFICMLLLLIWGCVYQAFSPPEFLDKLIRNATYLVVASIGVRTLVKRAVKAELVIFGLYLFFCVSSLYAGDVGLNTFYITHFLPIASFVVWANFFSYASDDQVVRFDKWMMLVAFLQIPISLIQLFTVDVWDDIGGTFGIKGTAVLCFFLFMVTGTLLIKNTSVKSDKFDKVKFSSMLLLLPLLLGEVKIAFILFPILIFFIALERFSVKRFLALLAIAVIGTYVAIVALNVVYKSKGAAYDTTEFSTETLMTFMVGDETYFAQVQKNKKEIGEFDIPRFIRLVIEIAYLKENDKLILGRGIGAHDSKTQDDIGLMLGYGTRILPVSLLDAGGILYMLYYLAVLAYMHLSGFWKDNIRNNRLKLFFLVLTLIGFLYQSMPFVPVYALFFTYYIEREKWASRNTALRSEGQEKAGVLV